MLEAVKARGYFEERDRIHRGPGLEAAFGLPPLETARAPRKGGDA